MKPAKTFLPVLAITLLFSSTAFSAQRDVLKHSTPLMRAKLQTGFMKKQLNLTRNQTEQVMAINLKYAKEMEPVIKANGGKLMKLRQASAIRKAKDAELMKVLSPGQYEAYQASKKQMREQMIDKIMHERGPAR
ncbi:MAG: hypothetical protein ACP5IL_09980 [Syntrophobacteraceae bacterium]